MTEPTTVYQIRLAGDADLDALVSLRTYAETWLHAADIDQWTDHARGITSIQAGLNSGGAHVVIDHQGDIVAGLTLAGPDPDFWQDSDQPDTGLYLYKFMLGPTTRGTGLGDALLDWACTQATHQHKTWLRLDCWRTNTNLQTYYTRRGFTLIRTVNAPHRSSGTLMQRPATLHTYTGPIHLHD